MSKYRGNYFYIESLYVGNRKTPILFIYSNKDESVLGQIKWFSSWRKFCFFPKQDTVWDDKCLKELTDYLNELNYEYKHKSKI